MIIITDILKDNIDEGSKVGTLNLLKHIKNKNSAYIIGINSVRKFGFIDNYFNLNKLLINLSFYKSIKESHINNILYIPAASITFFSFFRAKFLKIFTKKEVWILSLQFKQYNALLKILIKKLSPKCVITQSKKSSRYLSSFGIPNEILPLGVDTEKFYEFDIDKKKELRVKYKIELNKIVLLHVGHIQRSRNLKWLINIKEKLPDYEVVMVGSSFNQDDEILCCDLYKKGIKVIKEFIPNIENIYNVADYYVFPVLKSSGAIETPLSVLEAMACNLPVITTSFGSLSDTFTEDEYFHFVQSSDEIFDIVKEPTNGYSNNREKILPFTWEKVAQELTEIIYRGTEQKS